MSDRCTPPKAATQEDGLGTETETGRGNTLQIDAMARDCDPSNPKDQAGGWPRVRGRFKLQTEKTV